AGIVAGEGHNVRAPVLLEQSGRLCGTNLNIVDRVEHEPVPIIGDAKSLGGVAPSYRGDLHQSDRFGGRHVTLVKATFRAHNRIDDAAIELETNRLEGGHANVREGVLIHREAARERSLADKQHRPSILVMGSELAKSRDEGSVIAILSNIRHEAQE